MFASKRPVVRHRAREYAAAASSSSSSSAMDTEEDTRVSTQSASSSRNDDPDKFRLPVSGNAKEYRRPTREKKPPNPNNPEFDFLEEKSQSAFDTKCDALWLENNSDFQFCDRHKQVCEMLRFHPDSAYDGDCNKCLKEENGGLLRLFFLPEHDELTMEQAGRCWLEFHTRKKAVYAQLLKEPQRNVELQKRFDLGERSAWMRYWYEAWLRNNHRIKAVREEAARPGQSSSYNMLPPVADELLVQFYQHASDRNMQTGSGMQGKSCNVKLCDMHELRDGPAQGHAIQVLNKSRYQECGICPRPREESNAQRQADLENERSSGSVRAAYSFKQGN